MSRIKLPQNDETQKRQAELSQQASVYSYNYDTGIPLIESPGPKDANAPDYQMKLFALLMKIRFNIQAIHERSGLQFMTPKPRGDIPTFLKTLQSGGNPLDYFAPDLGFITNSKEARRPASINDYISKIFVDRDNSNQGSAPLPGMADKWDTDLNFAYNFIAGPNANQLVRYSAESRPADFDLSQINLASLPGFAGDKIENAINSGRVYFVDHSNLKTLFANLPNSPAPNAAPRSFNGVRSDDWKYIYAPYAAFAVPPDGKQILPVAIQCGPKSEGHQIYTPLDGYSWKMARVCVLAAHNNHHEVVSHLGLTHLLIDPVVIATRLHLHPNHPIHRLLSPHFEGTAAINVSARKSLIKPEKSVDRLIGSKIEMNYPYLRDSRLNFSFRDNFLKKRFASFQVNDSSLLPNYPYRDDSILIWDAINAWVSEYVEIWYPSEAAIQSDYELQNWANEVHDKGKVRDFCLTGGGVQSRDDLIDILTMTIFTAGPQHAAVNFPQGNEMLFVPANPLAGYAQAPKGRGHTEKDLLNIMPPLDVAVQTWSILSLLAGVNTTRLGDYRGSLQEHQLSEAGRIKFTQQLSVVESKIETANKSRRAIFDHEYVHLLPSRIPASINI
ncbi:MAG: lipoxygenase family protein [Oligoflexus sp.]